MPFVRRLSPTKVGLWVFLAPSLLSASERYELREGSWISINDCPLCARPSGGPALPLRGTFFLTERQSDGPTREFELSDLQFEDSLGRYRVHGLGLYRRHLQEPELQSLDLDLEIDGVGVLHLELDDLQVFSDEGVEVKSLWPGIDITVHEEHMNWGTNTTLRLVAAPEASSFVPYRLQEGSFLVDDCAPCGRMPIQVPIEGSFLLGRVVGGSISAVTYRIEAIDFRDASPTHDYQVAGTGMYSQEGASQDITLRIGVNAARDLHLEGLEQAVEARLPAISIAAAQEPTQARVAYSLQITALPSAEPLALYRRGDPNTDGVTDISDAVTILFWLFASSAAPGCLDAADANDDEAVQLSDAVFLLGYLFRDGPLPPRPGPTSCGFSTTRSLGCERYERCASSN